MNAQIAGKVAIATLLSGIALFLGVILWLRYRRPGSTTTSEYFLMGQDAHWFLVALSYAATLLSAFTFVGLPGFFYAHGIGTWLLIPFSNIAAVMVFLLYGDRLRRLQSRMSAEAGQVGRVKYSPFDIIASSYRSQNMAVAYFVVSAVFIMPHLAVQVAGAGKLAESLGISYNVGALGIVVVFVFYTTLAGMWGDVWTDAVQAVIMAIGLWVVAGILFWGKWPTIDMGMIVRDITESRGEGWFGLPGPAGFFTHISLMAYVIMFTAVTITQAPYAMRLLVARGPGDIRRAATVLPIILLVFFIPVLLISMYGAATYENLESGDALLGFALGDAFGGIGLVGQILLGLILLALVFAIVSTVDSQLLALGATFASDFYRKMKADVSDKEEVVVGRIVMGVIGIGALIIGLSPPKLIVQLAILSVSGTLQLLPAFLCAVVAPGKVSSISAWASVVTGLAVLLSMEAFGGLGVGRLPSGFVAVVAGSIMMGLCETIVRQARRGA